RGLEQSWRGRVAAAPPAFGRHVRDWVRGRVCAADSARPRAFAPVGAVNNSTHRNQRNPLPLIVAGDSLGFRIEREDAIDRKSVAMMSMLEVEGEEPG